VSVYRVRDTVDSCVRTLLVVAVQSLIFYLAFNEWRTPRTSLAPTKSGVTEG